MPPIGLYYTTYCIIHMIPIVDRALREIVLVGTTGKDKFWNYLMKIESGDAFMSAIPIYVLVDSHSDSTVN